MDTDCHVTRMLLMFLTLEMKMAVEALQYIERQTSSDYYLAYCPIRQGNYITYSSAMCYCRRGQQTQYDCRPATSSSYQNPNPGTQIRPSVPTQGTLPPLKPPPSAPEPPPPPNRPSTPPNVDTRPGPQLLFLEPPAVFISAP